MASLLPSYEYDIFISYRQKDNRSDQWVTNFVNALREELDSTFKEDISVYFDANPHDGLHETHDVDGSLKEKIKCLVFIPIISHTYCDPKSFAWQKELLPFVDFVKNDPFGLDIKLANGNVAKRVLPVRIHEIDDVDKRIFEEVIDGVIRPVDFIYTETGVNRPLLASDTRNENLNKTDYRNQINKTAYAIKQILNGLIYPIEKDIESNQATPTQFEEQKSIVVLPFVNISSEPEQEYFSDGLTEEIIADLSKLKNLLVISRSSAMTLKGSKKTLKEIAELLKVRYALEGSVRKSGNNLRITAQLIDAVDDSHLWAEKYSGTFEDIFKIQEEVSLSIVNALSIKLNNAERQNISSHEITNVLAFELYLKAKLEMHRGTKETLENTIQLLQRGLEVVGPNELIYASLGYACYDYFRMIDKVDKTYLDRAKEYAEKTLELNANTSHYHVILGSLHLANMNLQEAVDSMKLGLEKDPTNYHALFGLAIGYVYAGQSEPSRHIAKLMIEMDPLSAVSQIMYGVVEILDFNYDVGLSCLEDILKDDPNNFILLWQIAVAYIWAGRNSEAYSLIDRLHAIAPEWVYTNQVMFIKYGLQGDKEKALEHATDSLHLEGEKDPHFSFHIAECYAAIDEKEQALDFLEKSIKGFFPHKFLMGIPTFNNLKGNQRFEEIMQQAKERQDNFRA